MAKWNKDFTSIKRKGMFFKEWCEVNHFEYMIDELDEDYSREMFGLDLSNLTHGNDKLLKWKCKNPKHPPFYAKTVHRTNGQRLYCQYCSGSRQSLEEHSLQLEMPDLVEREWDYNKNEIEPDMIVARSTQKVWWICSKCGGSYLSSPRNRRDGRGCPICRGLKLDPDINSLAAMFPAIAEEWDYEKNDFSPYDVTYGVDIYVWWRCYRGHSFRQKICSRTGSMQGCPYCANNSTSFVEQALHYYMRYAFTDVYNRYRGFGKGYEYDIYLPEERVVIEYDGYNWHKGKGNSHKEQLAIKKGLFFIHILSRRDVNTFLVRDTDYGLLVECYSERSNPHSVDCLVKYVIDTILRRFGVENSDWSINTKRDFDIINTLYRNGGYIENAQDISLADS